MTDVTNAFPSDVEPLSGGHQLYVGLADLVEEYEDADMNRERMFYGIISFGKGEGNNISKSEGLFPPDIDEIPEEHQFYQDMIELVDEQENRGTDRERLMYGCISFGEYWSNQLYMTGSTW